MLNSFQKDKSTIVYLFNNILHHPRKRTLPSVNVLKIYQKKIKPVLQLKSAEKCVESWILFNVPLSQSSQFIFIVGHASGIKINLNLCKKFSLLNLNVFKRTFLDVENEIFKDNLEDKKKEMHADLINLILLAEEQ